jgi:peptide/nickel transport system permease protein
MSTVTSAAPRTRAAGLRPLARLRRLHASGRAGAVIIGVYVVVAVIGPAIERYPPDKLVTGPPLTGPSSAHWLGTDEYGRDVWSRLVVGERQTVLVAVAATLVSLLLGCAVGLYSGYRGGRTDGWVMRFVELVNSIPPLIAALVAISGFGGSSLSLILTIGVVYASRVVRVVRAVTLDVSSGDFVAAARARGERPWSIIRHEVLRNVGGVILVESGMRFAFTLTIISALAVLGFGASPPNPSWGLSISDGRTYITTQPWIALAPAIAIAVLVIAVNLLSDDIARLTMDRAQIGRLEGTAT